MTELVTFADLKKLLGLDGATESEYPALEIIRPSVADAIENYIGRKLGQSTYTDTIRVRSKSVMIGLNALPVNSITSVTIDAVATTAYTIADYGIELDTALTRGDVVVNYDGGYATIPADITRAALLQTAYEYQNADHIGAESVSTDGGSVQRPALGLLKEVQRLLKPFRHPLNRSF